MARINLYDLCTNCTQKGSNAKYLMYAYNDFFERAYRRTKDSFAALISYIMGEVESYEGSLILVTINSKQYDIRHIGEQFKPVIQQWENIDSIVDINDLTTTLTSIDRTTQTVSFNDLKNVITNTVDASYLTSLVFAQNSFDFIQNTGGKVTDSINSILSQVVTKNEDIVNQVVSVSRSLFSAGESLLDKLKVLLDFSGVSYMMEVDETSDIDEVFNENNSSIAISNYTGVNPTSSLMSGIDVNTDSVLSTITTGYVAVKKFQMKIASKAVKWIGNGLKKLFKKAKTVVTETFVDPVDYAVDGDEFNYFGESVCSTQAKWVECSYGHIYDFMNLPNKLNDGDLYYSVFGCMYRVTKDGDQVKVYRYINPIDIAGLGNALIAKFGSKIQKGFDVYSFTIADVMDIYNSLTDFVPMSPKAKESDVLNSIVVTQAISDAMLAMNAKILSRFWYAEYRDGDSDTFDRFVTETYDLTTTIQQMIDYTGDPRMVAWDLSDALKHILDAINGVLSKDAFIESQGLYMTSYSYCIPLTYGTVTNRDFILAVTRSSMLYSTEYPQRFVCWHYVHPDYYTQERANIGLISQSSYDSLNGWTGNFEVANETSILTLVPTIFECLFGISNTSVDGVFVGYSRFSDLAPNAHVRTDAENEDVVKKALLALGITAAAIVAAAISIKSITLLKKSSTIANLVVRNNTANLSNALLSGDQNTINTAYKALKKSKMKASALNIFAGTASATATNAILDGVASTSTEQYSFVPNFSNQDVLDEISNLHTELENLKTDVQNVRGLIN